MPEAHEAESPLPLREKAALLFPFVFRLIDGLIPPPILSGPAGVLRRARVLVGSTFIGLPTVLAGLVLGRVNHAPWLNSAVFLIVLAGILASLVALRVSSSASVPATIVASSLILMDLVAAVHRDGLPTITNPWFVAFVPLFVAYLASARRGIGFAIGMGLIALVGRGLERANLVSDVPINAADPGDLMAVTAAMAALAVGALGWLDNDGEQAATAALTAVMAKIRVSEANLISLIENTGDWILLLDDRGRLVTANSVVSQLWLKWRGQLPKPGDELTVPEEEGRKWRVGLARALQGERLSFEVTWTVKGVPAIYDISLNPVRLDGGRLVGVATFGRDITERKAAEVTASELQGQLLKVSRKAGMAEVATNVLHNVGNTLNSINISADLLSSSLQRSKVGGLAKAVDLIQARRGELGRFLDEDPKGQQLVAYLQSVSKVLLAERDAELHEVQALWKNIEHIKAIVNMQQAHATMATMIEPVSLTEMVGDALRLLAIPFESQGIRIEQVNEASGQVLVDRYKLLQILTNLLENARQALVEATGSDKLLSIRLSDRSGEVSIEVADNGVGVPPENIEKLFRQGFTTKKDGHGFGLHSSALAAKEMGGGLSCWSDGLGRGAVFTVKLPLRRPATG